MRKLASIQTVDRLLPIPGADAIECAYVQGWTAVVKKGEFQPGDLCVFMEVDSLLPETPWSEFLRSKNFRIKTVKLRGQLSQGLALPLSVFGIDLGQFVIGDDVTEILGVTKFELPENPQHVQSVGSAFPSWVPKTDEDRVQSSGGAHAAMQGRPYVITVKLDGSSMTVTYGPDDKFHVCSRNLSIDEPAKGESAGNFWMVARALDLASKLAGTTIALQGELCGPGIQKNRLNLKTHDFFAFNAYDWKAGRHLTPTEFSNLCEDLYITQVPHLESGDAFCYTREQLLEKAKGLYAGTSNHREGIVFRTDDDGPRISLKAISNSFLLKEEE